MKNVTLLCDVTVMLIRLEKIGNILFLKQHIRFLKKMNINHFYQKMHTAAKISTSGLHYDSPQNNYVLYGEIYM